MEKISKKRSLTKTLTYRVICTTETYLTILAVAWFIGDPSKIAAIAAGILLFTKIGTYYFHERVWAKIKWGRH